MATMPSWQSKGIFDPRDEREYKEIKGQDIFFRAPFLLVVVTVSAGVVLPDPLYSTVSAAFLRIIRCHLHFRQQTRSLEPAAEPSRGADDEEISEGGIPTHPPVPRKRMSVRQSEEQPLPPLPGYVTKSDPEEDPEEYEDDETEDGPVDYLMDGEDDGDDDDDDSSRDDANDEDRDEDEEEEKQLALARLSCCLPYYEPVPHIGT
ncbi:hypothetical protein Tco_0842305 [Tanacetum coccineum]|uniref:Uncharacterized protein n=1 Tax=Tanacetum coccineum TaxID=301880 RepID=A0ABQ5B265_9ASTR